MVSTGFRSAVVGASGFAGAEVVGLLANHPAIQLTTVVSRSFSGQPFSALYQRYSGQVDIPFSDLDLPQLADNEIVFLAVPHTASMKLVCELLELNPTLKIVDLAADYRFGAAEDFERIYGVDHLDPHRVKSAVYGLAEYNQKDIRNTNLVANPGCYATAALVPLVTLAAKKLIGDTVFIDAKSGISGAGRPPSQATTFVGCNEDIKPYKIGEHRHQPEIFEHMSVAADEVNLRFVPHVIPVDRGIEAAIYFTPPADRGNEIDESLRELAEQYELFRYREQPAGIKAVANTPYCDLSAHYDGRTAVVFSCIDNLLKGAASQAVQNANLMLGLDMNTAL